MVNLGIFGWNAANRIRKYANGESCPSPRVTIDKFSFRAGPAYGNHATAHSASGGSGLNTLAPDSARCSADESHTGPRQRL